MSSSARSPTFLRLWIGSTASGLATWALPFVLGLAVLDGTLSPVDLGIALAARTIGFLLAVPVSGVFADRSGRRRVVLYASLAAGIGIPIIIVGIALDSTSALLTVSLGAMIAGIGQGACRPAYQALVPLIVVGKDLQAANAAMSISVRVTNLAGPAAATALALAAGIPVALCAIVALWLMSAILPPWPNEGYFESSKGMPELSLAAFLSELAEGIEEARRHPWFLAGLGALAAVIAAGYSVTGVLLPIISRDAYGGAALLAGSATAYTLGALFGAIIVARWRPTNQGWCALAALGLYSLVPLSLLTQMHIAVPMLAFILAGIGIELFNVPWFTAIHREIVPDKLARVSSLDFLVSYGLAPAGLALIAPATIAFGNSAVLLISGAICLIAPAVACLVPSCRTFRR
ncbi:MFS transporter [Pelagibacterium sp. H642]|uniref:MFS transporter n=1 Tax=Pelagibacterium sp. H642 TaxID=1881069 RepID=UPI00281533B9|nr:MFS transporter [Pelagibacterium sp. H642]WMT92959.1 MFS transporter [Pelagibacterium sp. H642]